ncbi:MAG TPA: hypothetical protein VGJ87_26900 [Roseiflexaceae bacterium]|jgi:hypothetical protein
MTDNHSFDRWLGTVDRIVMQQCGGSMRDLPELRLRAAFDRGISPEAFCEQQLSLPPTTIMLDAHRGIHLLVHLLFG